MVTRRRFLQTSGAALTVAASPFASPALAQAKPRLVIVGGGPGGVSVVRKLVAAAPGRFDITLVEPKKLYTTCFFSNLYLGGLQSFKILEHGYDDIASLPDVTLAPEWVSSIDRDKKIVSLSGGQAHAYDRMVLSPGISLDYSSIPGWSKEAETKMPHGWIAGEQTRLLKKLLDAVPDEGLIVVIAPPNPYRCPPAPYERVSMMAHALKSSGRTNARIVVLDPKEKFAKQALFQEGWERHYPGMIEWMPPFIHSGITGVDPETMSVETGFETYKNADLVNVIPAQKAGEIARSAGLAGEDGYCPIDPFTLKSKLDKNIFVIGDAASAGDMPKAAFAADSHASAVVAAILHELLGAEAAAPEYAAKCWSAIGQDNSVFVESRFKPSPDKIEQVKSNVSGLNEAEALRRANFDAAHDWYAGFVHKLFG